MLSSLNLRCSSCDSMYTLSVEDLKVLALFRCDHCGQYNAYISGHILVLDEDIMDNGTKMERQGHVIEVVQDWARGFADNILAKVNSVIDVNVDIDLPISDSCDFGPLSKGEEAEKLSTSNLHPTILWVDAPAITKEEVRDFIRIDLNLVSRKRYFDRFFGGRSR